MILEKKKENSPLLKKRSNIFKKGKHDQEKSRNQDLDHAMDQEKKQNFKKKSKKPRYRIKNFFLRSYFFFFNFPTQYVDEKGQFGAYKIFRNPKKSSLTAP